MTTSDAGNTVTIKDNGEIEGSTMPQSADSPPSGGSANKPSANSSSGGIGSRTGSPVVLQSGAFIYKYTHEEVVLFGAFEIPMEITYLSEDSYSGLFGKNRRFSYEKQFVQIDENHYKLYLEDGRVFFFTQTLEGFVDEGDLGVEILIFS